MHTNLRQTKLHFVQKTTPKLRKIEPHQFNTMASQTDLDASQKTKLESLLMGLMLGLGTTSWEALQTKLLSLNPSLVPTAMLQHAYHTYQTSENIRHLFGLNESQFAGLQQKANAPATLCNYLATAPREHLEDMVEQTIAMCDTHCSPQFIRRHFLARWPDLIQPAYHSVLHTVETIMQEPATVRKMDLQNAKINSR